MRSVSRGRMHAEFPALTFDFTTKIEHILQHRELFPEFARLGCLFAVSAVESLSDTVLANLRERAYPGRRLRGPGRSCARLALRCVRRWCRSRHGRALDDYLDVFEVVEREGLIDHVDPVQYAIRLLIPPGSLLLQRPPFDRSWGHWIKRLSPTAGRTPIRAWMSCIAPSTALVEESTKADEDPALTFERIRALAYGRP